MPTNCFSCSPSPSAHHGWTCDSSDEPMSHRDRACRRSDKRKVAHSPSSCCYRSPSHEGCHEKCCRVTVCNNSPPLAQWIATTTGLLVHDPRDQCPKCLAYQHHISLDLVLETPSIMNARDDCLTNLMQIMPGWDNAAAKLRNEPASVCRDRDHWRRRAEEAERASAVSEQQVTATFEQASLLSMYIPSAHPEDTPGAGLSNRPLEEHLVSSGGGSSVTPASVHSREPCSRSPRPQSPGTIFSEMNINEPSAPAPSGSSLVGRLKEMMFPLLGRGEVPNRVSVLLDGKQYLHVQVGEWLYQFDGPTREDILRNLRAHVPPPLTGTIPPGAVRLFNMIAKLDRLYALVARESEEHNSPNTKLGQRLVAWLNRYLADSSCTSEEKPRKNNVVIHALSKWRPPAWVMSCGKNKHEGYKKAYQAAQESTHVQHDAPPLPLTSVPEVPQPPAASSLSSIPEASQPLATSSSSSVLEVAQPPVASSLSAPATTHPHTFGGMSISQQPILPPIMLPLILTRSSRTTHRQDGLPGGAPSWGDELTEWRDFIHCLCRSGMAHRFLGI